MSKKTKIIIIAAECVVLALVLGIFGFTVLRDKFPSLLQSTTVPPTTEVTTAPPTTQEPTEPPTTEPTLPPQTDPAPTEPPPTEIQYLLSFAGDCTLGNQRGNNRSSSFLKTVGEDYAWPFAGVLPYFEADDFTLVNFEGTLTSSSSAADKLFTFKAPAVYATCLTAGSVECVNLANNHTYDYGTRGYEDTKSALTDEGIPYVGENGTLLYTTRTGLVIGVYAEAFNVNYGTMRAKIAKLKEAGAEIIIFSIHWGDEGSYRPTSSQKKLARAAIDAGANIVYGHHPHVLQPIEEYNGGIIYYSVGNFSFGGNTNPKDKDTVILQQQIIRGVDGAVRLGELNIIPCSVSSRTNQNDYQPTPLTPGSSAYDRVLSKLDGSFSGANLSVGYDASGEFPD